MQGPSGTASWWLIRGRARERLHSSSERLAFPLALSLADTSWQREAEAETEHMADCRALTLPEWGKPLEFPSSATQKPT